MPASSGVGGGCSGDEGMGSRGGGERERDAEEIIMHGKNEGAL